MVPEFIQPTKSRQPQEPERKLATKCNTAPIQFHHGPTILRERPSSYGPRPFPGPPERRTPDERKGHPKPRRTWPSPNGFQQYGVLPMWADGTLRARLPPTTSSSTRTSHRVDRTSSPP